MKISINGNMNVNRYYVQSLCQLFFPGEKFSQNGEEDASEPSLFLDVSKDGNLITAQATFKAGVKTSHEISQIEIKKKKNEDKTSKLALGNAVYRAGTAISGSTPAWGMLVGIRPAKLALEMLDTGKSPLAVRRYLRHEYMVNPKKATLCTDVAQNERAILELASEDTCSLYISIPFCPTKCAYCSFVSYSTNRLLSMIPDYVDRLCRDIESAARQMKRVNKRLISVYIGGGTPTILTNQQLEKLLSSINKSFDVGSLLEFTLEAGRPDTIDEDKIRTAKKYGVTRVSINPQTLNDNILESIGRNHTSADFYKAFELARSEGIREINCDLIAGLPGESYPSFSKSVDSIIALAPENITVHTFCVKKSAEVRRREDNIFKLNGNDTEKSIDYSQLRMKNSGYKPYYMYRQKNAMSNLENVGFSLDGHMGIYNVLIMEERHTVFALGAGAVAKFVRTDEDGVRKIQRIYEPKYPYEYMREDEAENEKRYFNAIDDFFA